MVKATIEFRRRFNALQFILNFRCLFDFFSRFLPHTEPIIRLKVMSGKILIEWKHNLCRDVSKARYIDPDIARSTHIDIANIFFNPDQDDSDEISSEHNSGGKYLYSYDLPWRQPCHKSKTKQKVKIKFPQSISIPSGSWQRLPFFLISRNHTPKSNNKKFYLKI